MKIYDHRDDEGRLLSFEVPNVGRRYFLRLLRSAVPSSQLLQQKDDHFGTIHWNGTTFEVTEPWGDSSRYLIHPLEPSSHTKLEELRELIARAESRRHRFLFIALAAAMIITAVLVIISLS